MLANVQVRRAGREDIAAAVQTITEAFQEDPMWGWAFPDAQQRPAQYRQWWAIFVASATRYDWTWLADDAAAVAVWIPPGGVELTDEDEAAVEPLLRELIGPWTDTVLDGLHGFDTAHPRDEPHYYLSLLGTRNDRRGEGIGMALLREGLAVIDAEGSPAYLESTNPANNRRYEGAGFVDIGTFAMPDDGPVVTRMWRPARR
jgi:GNAT superfamily N-acetyltransferase